jgi:hypothetical protein
MTMSAGDVWFRGVMVHRSLTNMCFTGSVVQVGLLHAADPQGKVTRKRGSVGDAVSGNSFG